MTVYSSSREDRAPAIRCQHCPIRDRAVCAYSSSSELSLLEAIKSYRTYLPGEEIAATGEPLEKLGSIVEGVVSMSRILADGRRQTVGLLFPGDFVGRVQHETAQYDAVAVDEVTLCLFDRRRFERLLSDSADLRNRLLDMTLDELDAAREWMVVLGRKTAREKIASFLSIVMRRRAGLRKRPPWDGIEIDLPLTREAMADYLGLTIETVSRQIGALKRDGTIKLNGARNLTIPDVAALCHAAGDDVIEE
ncbi:MAG: helix-turn-helix domain-containing protein [Pseudomonadota bacterium]